MAEKIQIILFAGFLGSGKTTLISQTLKDFAKDKKVALLINDFGEYSLDGILLKKYGIPTSEIAGGSIFCCCKQANLIEQLNGIAKDIKPELLLIEASGLAEPTDTASLLQNTFLRKIYSLPQVVTTVDVKSYYKLSKILRVIDLQIKLADVIVLTKINCYTDVEKISADIKQLNHKAEIMLSDEKTLYGKLMLLPTNDCALEAPLRLCSTATPGFSVVNFSGQVEIEDLEKLLIEYKSQLLRAKGVINGKHLELVDGQFTWSNDLSLEKNGLFFALQGEIASEFKNRLNAIEK